MKHPGKAYACVQWGDAHGAGDEVAEKDIKHAPEIYQTYGWILKSDADGVSLGADWNVVSNTWRDRNFIPRAMVIEEQIYDLSKKRARRKAVATGKEVTP